MKINRGFRASSPSFFLNRVTIASMVRSVTPHCMRGSLTTSAWRPEDDPGRGMPPPPNGTISKLTGPDPSTDQPLPPPAPPFSLLPSATGSWRSRTAPLLADSRNLRAATMRATCRKTDPRPPPPPLPSLPLLHEQVPHCENTLSLVTYRMTGPVRCPACATAMESSS